MGGCDSTSQRRDCQTGQIWNCHSWRVSPQNRSEKSWDRSWNPLASLSAWRWGRLFQRVLERCKSMWTSVTMLSACRGCSAARWAGACNVWEWNLKPGDSQWEARPRLDWELEPTWCDRWVQSCSQSVKIWIARHNHCVQLPRCRLRLELSFGNVVWQHNGLERSSHHAPHFHRYHQVGDDHHHHQLHHHHQVEDDHKHLLIFQGVLQTSLRGTVFQGQFPLFARCKLSQWHCLSDNSIENNLFQGWHRCGSRDGKRQACQAGQLHRVNSGDNLFVRHCLWQAGQFHQEN